MAVKSPTLSPSTQPKHPVPPSFLKPNVKKVSLATAFSLMSTALLLIVSLWTAGVVGRETSLFLLLAAVVISSWFGGLLQGILATLLSLLSAVYLIYHATSFSSLMGGKLFAPLGFFLLEGIFISSIVALSKQPQEKFMEQFELKEDQYLEQLERLHKETIRARKEIQARDEFLSIASHELKTPISSLILQMQTALHSIRSVSLANFSVENLMKMLESAEQQSERVSKMINDLLNVSLITTGKMELELETVDLSQTITDVLERFKTKLEKEKYTLHADIQKGVSLTADKLRLEQAISNLITNAMKYGDSKPITISLRKLDHTAQILVQDQGIGMSEEQQKRIFARFERAVHSSAYKGLGVGLYITHQIIKAHQGTITVASRPHEGSVFCIELPLTLSPAQQQA